MNLQNALTIETNPQADDIEQRLKLLIVRDLFQLKWDLKTNNGTFVISPPTEYAKDVVKQSMNFKRQEILIKNQIWINNHVNLLRDNLATGKEAFKSEIIPSIEVCTTDRQHELFRICRYYWSSPYSDYVGRRIKLLVRDEAIENRPIIGIAALGSPIIHIPERDNWIEWDTKTRTNNLIFCMDAYVLGAMPPYNTMLGGKLIAYILASNEIRKIYKEKYENICTNINNRISTNLVCLFTTSLYGRSSQYNRIQYNEKYLYNEIGKTKGFGSLHLTNETFLMMQNLLIQNNIIISNRFGDGPNWRMRVIREACDIIGINSDMLLKHSFKRNIYAIPLAENYKKILLGEEQQPNYHNYPMKDLADYWRERWFNSRKKYLLQSGRINEINTFNPLEFTII
ncbi:hypothetical protein FACS1894110_16780 [Spirochaetia bacterium]|nr:hypothetical protein FACS1894110_16780 [Spirochaetia bacterium]